MCCQVVSLDSNQLAPSAPSGITSLLEMAGMRPLRTSEVTLTDSKGANRENSIYVHTVALSCAAINDVYDAAAASSWVCTVHDAFSNVFW